MDALLANWDRHCQNWGFLKQGDGFSFAPIFDNAGCLYSYADKKKRIEDTLTHPELMKVAIEDYPATRLRTKEGYSSHYYVLEDGFGPEMDAALTRIYPRIDLNKIEAFLDDCLEEEPLLLLYYKTMIRMRYETILTPAYHRAIHK